MIESHKASFSTQDTIHRSPFTELHHISDEAHMFLPVYSTCFNAVEKFKPRLACVGDLFFLLRIQALYYSIYTLHVYIYGTPILQQSFYIIKVVSRFKIEAG